MVDFKTAVADIILSVVVLLWSLFWMITILDYLILDEVPNQDFLLRCVLVSILLVSIIFDEIYSPYLLTEINLGFAIFLLFTM